MVGERKDPEHEITLIGVVSCSDVEKVLDMKTYQLIVSRKHTNEGVILWACGRACVGGLCGEGRRGETLLVMLTAINQVNENEKT